MKRFLVLTKAMFLIHLRNRSTLFWNLLFPLFILVIYAVVFGRNNVGDQNYMSWVLPGVLVLNILAFGILGSSAMMVQMREKGVLGRLQATPIPSQHLIGGYLLANVSIGILQCVLIITFGVLFFKAPIVWGSLLVSAPLLMVGILTFVAMGQVISGIVTTAGIAVAIGQIIYFSLMFITDLVMPLQMMPDLIQKIAPYLPSYALVQLVRPALIEGNLSPDLGINLLVLGAYTILAGLLAVGLFRWQPRA